MKKWFFLVFLFFGLTTFAHAAEKHADSTVAEYTGKYIFPEGSVVAEVNVTLASDGTLTMSSTAGNSELTKRDKDLFDIPRFQGTAKFSRDSNGKIVGVSIDAMGYKLEGTKTAAGS